MPHISVIQLHSVLSTVLHLLLLLLLFLSIFIFLFCSAIRFDVYNVLSCFWECAKLFLENRSIWNVLIWNGQSIHNGRYSFFVVLLLANRTDNRIYSPLFRIHFLRVASRFSFVSFVYTCVSVRVYAVRAWVRERLCTNYYRFHSYAMFEQIASELWICITRN